ncbi:glycoside hydrolase family 88 protein [Archangium violaceum]|uniref:glycoside hydrolase family 88/105 protein n=1 Tax=Archangium violaceum TaxID=83451 RepID=UPI00193B1EAB|nr:glycoside hydrolase family 88 protein [Archangium violaceum]QRK06641.1 glycoside hydrolase family 88 protein [Archangium violaceum]
MALANSIIKEWPDPDTITTKRWEYTNGVLFVGFARLHEKTQDRRYLDYIKTWVDKYVDSNGNIPSYPDEHNLDLIQPANLFFPLYEATQDPKYKLAAANIRARYADFPVNSEGGFWHKTRYPNEMWLDGIYMAGPYIAQYGAEFATSEEARTESFDTVVKQIKLIHQHTYNPTTKLHFHAWDADRNVAWANPDTGVSPIHWNRSMGWLAMALVDTLEHLPSGHSDHQDIQDILRNVAEGLKSTQDPVTGLWYQVLDKGDQPDNWLETSGSAMFVYALKKAVTLGYISDDYARVAQKGWEGVKSKITYGPDGHVVVRDSVQGMGVQVDYANYVNKERVENLPQGMFAVMLASTVME